MTTVIIQKLLISVITLTTFFLIYIIALHYDLTRRISKSLFQLVPAFIMFLFGIFVSRVLSNPETVFTFLLPIKSGMIKGVLGTIHLPLIAATVKAMSIIACLTSLIDKFWYYWRSHRLLFIFRMIISIGMTVIAGNTLFNIIYLNQKQLCAQIDFNNKLGFWAGTTLGIILLLVVILSIPTFFNENDKEKRA